MSQRFATDIAAQLGELCAATVAVPPLAADGRAAGGQPLRIEPGLLTLADQVGPGAAVTGESFTEDRWHQLTDALCAVATWKIALATGTVPDDLFDPTVATAGATARAVHALRLDVGTTMTCSCDRTGPCRHRRDLARAIVVSCTADPWLVMSFRGGRADLIGAAAAVGLNTAADTDDPSTASTTPKKLWGRRISAPPEPIPAARGHAVSVDAPPLDSGLLAADLVALAGDAARRATRMLQGDPEPHNEDEELADAIGQRLAGRPKSEWARAIAGMDLGTEGDEIERRVIAWELDGIRAVRLLTTPPTAPDGAQLAEGVRAIEGPARARRHWVTAADGSLQLRLSEEGLWYPFVPDPRLGWVMCAAGQPTARDARRAADTRRTALAPPDAAERPSQLPLTNSGP